MTPKNALDHVVVGVPDLSSARRVLSRLGFQVQADAHHPFGTGNCNVFFSNGTYFEPLAVTDRDAELLALKEANPFVSRYNAFRFRHGFGPVMAAFTTQSAERMNQVFADAGISAGDIVSFTRAQDMPDGGETTIGVHLALAHSELAPDITLFTCEHLSRDILWQPERLVHPNGAIGIGRLIAVESNPSDFQYLFQAVTGDRELRTTSVGMEMDLPNAMVSVVSPAAYQTMTGIALAVRGRGPRIEAVEIQFGDLRHLRELVASERIPFDDRGDVLIVPAHEDFPITLLARAGMTESFQLHTGDQT